MNQPTPAPRIVHEDLQATQQCVMCGMCVPHCPTYALTQNEADGPRGRIVLMLGVAQGQMTLDDAAAAHLQGCLSCRACEVVCPSKVPYGKLIDAAKAHLVQQNAQPGRWIRRLRDHVLIHPWRLRRLADLARMAQRLRVQRLPMPAGSQRLLRLLPPLAPAFQITEAASASPKVRGRVGLFLGCMGEAFEAESLRAAVHVLRAWGFEVVIPAKQGCCGAMHQHGGEPARGTAMAAQVAARFAHVGVDHVVGVSSGCVAQLKEHGGMAVNELSDFLLQHMPDELPAMRAIARRVAVHLPCTQRNVLRTGSAAVELLRLIPELEVVELPGNARCCGAAGTHMLTHPQQADALRAPKIDAFDTLHAAQLCSTNIGCAMHLGAGLRARDEQAEVVHPVRLLAEALLEGGSATQEKD